MNEKLKKQLTEAIEKVEEAENFTVEQSPELIQEFLQRELLKGSIGVIISLIVLAASIYGIIKLIKIGKEEFDPDTIEGGFIIFLFLIISSVMSFFIAINCFLNVLFIYNAPKWFILENLSYKL